jgi:hypothetical protein
VAVVGSQQPALGWQPWDRSELDYPSTTLLAMQAVQAAKDPSVGGLAVSEELDAALRHAWYAQSLSIHLFDVILAVAAEHTQADVTVLARVLRSGLPSAWVFADWADAEQSEVQGSPHLFFADGTSVHNPGISLSWTVASSKACHESNRTSPGCIERSSPGPSAISPPKAGAGTDRCGPG